MSLLIAALVLLVLAGVFIAKAKVDELLPFTDFSHREELIIGGIVFVLASYMMWRWHLKANKG